MRARCLLCLALALLFCVTLLPLITLAQEAVEVQPAATESLELYQESSADELETQTDASAGVTDLGTINVYGERSLQELLRDTHSLTVIEVRGEAGSSTLGSVIERAAGVDVQSLGGAGQLTTLQVRGSRANQVLVLVDGAPLAPGGAADLTLLPIGAVERVEVLRGPEAARFGAGALGGVLNVVTHRPTKPEPPDDLVDAPAIRVVFPGDKSDPAGVAETSLSLSAGSFGALGSALSYSDADLSLFVSAQRAQNDFTFMRGAGEPVRRENNQSAQQNLWAAWDAGGLSWRAGLTNQRRGVPGSAEFPTLQASLERQGLWAQAAGGRWRADLSLLNTHFSDPQPYLHEGPIDARDTQSHLAWSFGLLADQVGTWGVRPRLDLVDSSEYGKHSRAGLDATRAWSARWGRAQASLELGLTASSDAGVDPLGHAGLSWKLRGGGQSYIAVGYAARHPDFSELYLTGMGSVEGNPDLQPERVWNVEAGAGWNSARTSVGFAAFYSAYQDSIIFAPVSAYLVRAINSGEARVGGAEAAWDLRLGRELWWRTAYTWLPLAEFASGVPLTGRAEHHANSRLELNDGPWSAALSLDYTGRLPADLFGNLSIKPRALTGLELAKRIGASELSLSINNLFDTPARDSWNYPLPGRDVRLSWRIEL